MTADLIREQIEYYRARAPEYDDWFYRRGRYDRGPEVNTRWFEEAATIQSALQKLGSFEQALDIACGTGIWTEQLLGISQQVTAIDSSPEALDLNRRRVNSGRVRHLQADLFDWEPDCEYDLVCFCFWLSHVPPERLESFVEKVRRSTRVGGKIFLVDSLYESASTAKDHTLGNKEQNWQSRKLNDGREFRVVKMFYDPAELQATLERFGFEARVQSSGSFFLYGSGTRR